MKINVKDLVEALSIVRPAVLNKGTLVEQANHYLFTGDEVVSYNDVISIRTPFGSDFKGSVKANLLDAVLREIDNEEVVFSLVESKFVIKSKQIKSELSVLTHLDLLDQLPSVGTKWIDIPEGFIKGISLCRFSASKDMTQPILSCVGIDGGNIFSSDDVRISWAVFKGKKKEKFLIPASAVDELVKFSIFKYQIEESWIHFKTDKGAVFSSRRVEGKYPDPSKFFDVQGVEINFPTELKEVVDSIGRFSEGKLVFDNLISLSLDKNFIVCKADFSEGFVEKKIEIGKKSLVRTPIEFKINPYFLSEVLEKSTKFVLGKSVGLFESEGFKHVMSLPMQP